MNLHEIRAKAAFENIKKRIREYHACHTALASAIRNQDATIFPSATEIVKETEEAKPLIPREVFLQGLRNAAVDEDDLASDVIPEKIEGLDNAAEVLDAWNSEHDTAVIGSKAVYESFSLTIELNEQQVLARETAFSGKSFCLIGAAGTGKTTTQRSVAAALLQDQKLDETSFKVVGGSGARVNAPSIAFCAYTRRAAANLRRAVHKDPNLEDALRHNIMTIHQLLEYEPETYYDAVEGKQKFRFVPRRNAQNPLTITHLVIEEASMLGLDLWEKLYDALPFGVQIIFIGDINQIPPVFGPSILNFALVQLPVVELTQVYRNQGIILENAHRILDGQMPIESEKWQIIQGKSETQVGQEKMSKALAAMFEGMYNRKDQNGNRLYDPEDCIVLTPFNVQPLGSDNMNLHIAQFLGAERGAVVHEVIAGFQRLYLAEGDRVMYDKRDAFITKITRNMKYYGKEPQQPGADLSRFGVRIIGHDSSPATDIEELSLDYSNFDIDKLADEKTERKQQCSHLIDIEFIDGGGTTLEAAGDFTPQIFSLGYVLTGHKAQGSEWRKVFIMLHKDHAISLYREYFYTLATRPREEVVVFAKKFLIEKAIKNQRIKGRTLADKIAFFNSGVTNVQEVFCTK